MSSKEDFSSEVVPAQKVGLDPERLNRLKRTIEKDTEEGIYDGAIFTVARHGKIAMYEAVGKTDLEKNRPAKVDDVFFTMSITKQFN